MFEALNLIKDEFKNVEVWIVGDGEMRKELENQVQALQLNNVSFLGERNDIPELLSQSDIFVLPLQRYVTDCDYRGDVCRKGDYYNELWWNTGNH